MDTEVVLFRCQQCKQPLEIDYSGANPLQESHIAEFMNPAVPPHHLNDSFKKKEKETMDMLQESFVMLKQQHAPGSDALNTAWNNNINVLRNVFELASDKCQLDHPLCNRCSELVVRELEKRIRKNEEETAKYQQICDTLQDGPESSSDSLTVNASEEKSLEDQLALILKERAALAEEQRKHEEESKLVSEYEEGLWDEYQQYTAEAATVTDELQAIKQQISVSQQQLERLKRTNVFNDAFHITSDGHFGTINGFRLGRLPSQAVEWGEINAALGQVVLLLHTIAERCNYKFKQYKLIPMGSFSKISRLDDPSAEHELYQSSDMTLGKLFWYRRFDTALVWLLECIKEFGHYASGPDPAFRLKYSVKGDLIEGHSIKLQFNDDAKWTKALKYMLTNLKSLLAWASKHYGH